MKRIVEEYGLSILYFILGTAVIICLIKVLEAVST